MNITWVISEDTPGGVLNPDLIKEIAPSWGSWKTWKEYRTENCICTDTAEANNLIKRAFHAICNLYIMQSSYSRVGSPMGVKLFNGEFKSETMANKDDLVALNLAVPQSDIVLMSGFNFSPILTTDDELVRKSREEYYYNVRDLVEKNKGVQFVLVDYTHELASWMRDYDNITLDTVENVKSLLG